MPKALSARFTVELGTKARNEGRAAMFGEIRIGLEPRYALLLPSPTVYETLGALNAFKNLGGLVTNRVRSSASKS
jgi:hypothetical protein